jgi:DNA-binding GntR family transcriptional regulator
MPAGRSRPSSSFSTREAGVAHDRFKRPQSLADQAADQIRRLIVKGHFQLGEALSETTLAAELGVSKTPIREAFLRLRTEGLVDIQPQRGTFVFRMSAAEVSALSEFRDVLETAALTLAMHAQAGALASDLARIVADMAEALARADAATYREHDSRFHECIISHGGNPHLREAYGRIAFRIQTLRNRLSLDPALNAISLKEHEALAGLVAAGRQAEALAFLRTHIAKTTSDYQQIIGPAAGKRAG